MVSTFKSSIGNTKKKVLQNHWVADGFARLKPTQHVRTAVNVIPSVAPNIVMSSASVLSSIQKPLGNFKALKGAGLGSKFRQAGGLRRLNDLRSDSQAFSFYNDSLPWFVRNLGPDAVKEFLKGKQASHIESVANARIRAKDSTNILWELGFSNRWRGARNMNAADQAYIKVVNGLHTTAIVGKAMAVNAARSSFISVLFEVPITTLENGIYWKRGIKARDDAIRDSFKDIRGAVVSGAVVGTVLTGAVALGAGGVLVVVAPIVAPVGLGLYGATSIVRVAKAMRKSSEITVIETPVLFLPQTAYAAGADEGTRDLS